MDSESKSSYLSNQFAVARSALRFRRNLQFNVIGEVRFGVEYNEPLGSFVWRITLVPEGNNKRLDDAVWHQLQKSEMKHPEATHLDKENNVRFVRRPLDSTLTAEVAFNDIKSVLEFLLTAGNAIRSAVDLDFTPEEMPQNPVNPSLVLSES